MINVLLGRQEVSDILIVNLEVGTSHEKLHCAIVIWAVINETVDVLKRVRDDTPMVGVSIFDSHHSVRFSASSLTIGKDGAIVALHDIFDDGVGDLNEHVVLFGVPVIHLIEGELFRHIVGRSLD